jgi:hypothetical protein
MEIRNRNEICRRNQMTICIILINQFNKERISRKLLEDKYSVKHDIKRRVIKR